MFQAVLDLRRAREPAGRRYPVRLTLGYGSLPRIAYLELDDERGVALRRAPKLALTGMIAAACTEPAILPWTLSGLNKNRHIWSRYGCADPCRTGRVHRDELFL